MRTLNEAEHLEKLVFGLRRQTRRVDDFVLVDSGSSDGTVELAEKLGFRVTHIPKSEFSFGRSLNIGFDFVDADLVINLSAHVYPLSEEFVEKLLEPFEDETVGFTYGRQVGNSQSAFSEKQLMLDWYPPHPKSQTSSESFANNANAAVRKLVWEKYKFDEELPGLEDIEFAKRISAAGIRTEYCFEAAVVHIHDEVWKKIFNRYRREAIALSRFSPNSTVSFFQAFGLATLHILRDAKAAKFGLFGEILGILRFRTAQFMGAFVGGREGSSAIDALLKDLYFPKQSIKAQPSEVSGLQKIDYKNL